VRKAILRHYAELLICQRLGHRNLQLVFVKGSVEKVHSAGSNLITPFGVVVTVEEHELLAAAVVIVELLRVSRIYEVVLSPMHEKSRH
jgi:hypothetical protein